MPVLTLLTLVFRPAAAGDWNSLGQFSKVRTVKVHLNNGHEIKGTIQQVGPEALQFAAEKNRTVVKLKELANAVDKTRVGQVVEVRTQSGQILTGTLHEANEYYVYIDETKNLVQINREEIRRITFHSRGTGAVIGLAIGAGAGSAVGFSAKSDAALAAVGGAAVFGLVGAAAGGIIGIERTIYQNPMPNAKARK
jgi:small nuclear ribonucleoprotein (snRNP)-like protein